LRPKDGRSKPVDRYVFITPSPNQPISVAQQTPAVTACLLIFAASGAIVITVETALPRESVTARPYSRLFGGSRHFPFEIPAHRR